MSNIPSRDISGKCEGECRNLVREGEKSRQSCIESVSYSFEEGVPSVPWASSRNVSPGFFGGHV
jgi:hypothetical protein